MGEGYYSSTMEQAQVDVEVFKSLVNSYFPRLWAQMQDLDVDLGSLSTQWFLGLFVNTLPWYVRRMEVHLGGKRKSNHLLIQRFRQSIVRSIIGRQPCASGMFYFVKRKEVSFFK